MSKIKTAKTATNNHQVRTGAEMNVQQKFVNVRKEMRAAMIERDEEIDVLLTALIAMEHPLFVGAPGCLRWDVPIYDPIDNTTKTVAQRHIDAKTFHVLAFDHEKNKVVITKAQSPYLYPVAKMIQIDLSNGETFTVTHHHRIWTGDHYVYASQLRVGDKIPSISPYVEQTSACSPPSQSVSSPLPTTSDTCPSTSPANVPHWKQTAANLTKRRSLDHRLYDEPLPSVANNDLCCPPSPTDSAKHNHASLQKDDPRNEYMSSRPTPKSHHAKTDYSDLFAPQTASILELPQTEAPDEPSIHSSITPLQFLRDIHSGNTFQPDAPTLCPSISTASSFYPSPICELVIALPQYVAKYTKHHHPRTSCEFPSDEHPNEQDQKQLHQAAKFSEPFHTSSRDTNNNRTSYKEIITVTITSVKPVNAERYYDFHVPIFNNYFACGVLHHNTGKSLMLDSLVQWIDGGTSFSVLLNKFTTPEEVFGPISLQGLKADKYTRITTNKLPEAHIAYLDEVFKASTAILNTTLRVLNERVYENGDGTFRKTPLLSCVAASNEWPSDGGDGKELGALLDRFLFRKTVRSVSPRAGRKALLARAVDNNDCRPTYSEKITPAEIETANVAMSSMPWTVEAKKAIWTILETLNKEGIFPSDRRQYKAIGAARAYAYLSGAKSVEVEHLEILSHVLWDDPQEQPEKAAKIIRKIANPVGHVLSEKLAQIEEIVASVKDNKTAIEAATKLEAIGNELEALPHSERRDRVINHHADAVRQNYHRVVGVKTLPVDNG